MNILYYNIHNPLYVFANWGKEEDLLIEIDYPGAKIEKGNSSGNYTIWIPSGEGEEEGFESSLEIVLRYKKDKRYKATFRFRVLRIPIIVRLNHSYSGEICSEVMRECKYISSYWDGRIASGECEVSSFSLRYTPKNGEAQELKSTSEIFSGAILEAIQQTVEGDQFIFYDIMVRCPGDRRSFWSPPLPFIVR